ncbi:MAG: 2TM domain-containing protein [Acidimicrobiales bacterium]
MDDFSRAAFREREAKMIRRRRVFILHLSVYATTNLFLFVVWLMTGRGYPWFIFPIFGWGIGLAAHFVVALMLPDPDDIVLEREQRRQQ